jgi:hypothetical protein
MILISSTAKRCLSTLELQEPYIGVYSFSHPGYEIKWPKKGENKEKRVLIAIKKDLLTKVIMEVRLDLVNHSYVLALDI